MGHKQGEGETQENYQLPIIEDSTQLCDFRVYNADVLMKETSKLRKLITKKGTLKS
jgi:hypothetical protein